MKIRLMIISLLFLSGCSSTYILKSESSVDFYQKLNNSATKWKADIYFDDGEVLSKVMVEAGVDTTRYRYQIEEKWHSLASSSIRQITVRNREKGQLSGLGGCLLGAISGALIGSVVLGPVDYPGRTDCEYAEVAKNIEITCVAGLGAVLGTITAYKIGMKEHFIFKQAENDSLNESSGARKADK